MQEFQPSVLARDDTFFGVCHAIGEDFGFSPNWLRVGFAVFLYFNPVAALLTYLGLAVLVLATRLIVRNPRIPLPAAPVEPSMAVETRDEKQPELALAA